jgi:hypothetical protein
MAPFSSSCTPNCRYLKDQNKTKTIRDVTGGHSMQDNDRPKNESESEVKSRTGCRA